MFASSNLPVTSTDKTLTRRLFNSKTFSNDRHHSLKLILSLPNHLPSELNAGKEMY